MLWNSHTFCFISVSSITIPPLSMKADSIVLLFFRLLLRSKWALNCSDGGQQPLVRFSFYGAHPVSGPSPALTSTQASKPWRLPYWVCFPSILTRTLDQHSSSERRVHVPAGPHGFALSEKHPLLVDFYVLQMIINLRLFRCFATHLSLVKRKKKSCWQPYHCLRQVLMPRTRQKSQCQA